MEQELTRSSLTSHRYSIGERLWRVLEGLVGNIPERLVIANKSMYEESITTVKGGVRSEK